MEYIATHRLDLGLCCLAAGHLIALWRSRATAAQPPALHPEIQDAEIEAELRAGRCVEAIRLYRKRDGSGLVQARAAVDAMARRLGLKS